MNRIYFRTLQISIAILLLSLIMSLSSEEATLLTFINNSFLLSLPLLILGGFLFVLEAGFFNSIIYSFNRLGRSLAKTEVESSLDDGSPHQPAAQKSYSITKPLLFSGSLIFSLSMLAGFLIS